ncbi:probable sulfate transporter [Tanacetum coccineum]
MSRDLETFMDWAYQVRHLKVMANADTPNDALTSRNNGVQGNSLRRTKHIEGIPIGRTFADLKNYQVDGNKEITAIGLMNMAGSCSSCYVTTGTTSKKETLLAYLMFVYKDVPKNQIIVESIGGNDSVEIVVDEGSVKQTECQNMNGGDNNVRIRDDNKASEEVVWIMQRKDFLKQFQYFDKDNKVSNTKTVKVMYDWKPPMCTKCKVFGHMEEKCGQDSGKGGVDNKANIKEKGGLNYEGMRFRKTNDAGATRDSYN